MPDVRSLVGRLLQKKKGQQQVMAPSGAAASTVTPPPVAPPVDEAANKLAIARQKVQASLAQVGREITALPYAALKTPLDKVATTLRAQMATLDTLPDVTARSSRLMQIGEAAIRLTAELRRVEAQATQLQATDSALTQAFTALNLQVGAISLVPVRQPLADRLAALRLEQTTAQSALDASGLQALAAIDAKAAQLKTDATQAQVDLDKAGGQVVDWVDNPQTALARGLTKVPAGIRTKVTADQTAAIALGAQAKARLAQGKFAEVEALAGQAYWAFDAIAKRLAALQQIETLQTRHDESAAVLVRLKAHPQFAQAFTAQAGVLGTVVAKAKTLLATGESATAMALTAMADELAPAQRAATKSLAEYDSYQLQRKTVDTAVAALRQHAQTAAIQAEIAQIEQGLLVADRLGAQADGGWHRAKVALGPLGPQHLMAKALADKLAAAAAQLPVLAKKLEDGGMPKVEVAKVAAMAHKLLVEEGCTADQAVSMARSASRFSTEGMDEPDALLSARVKQRLLDDPTVDEELAHAIGQNLRGRGTASIDDIKCVADEMKRMSPKALKALNDAGIVTGICRGPVTDMIPELADVNPRGWGERTWDEVPGCYMGSKKMVVVGTMDDGTGKRKVPGNGEGPIPHGTPDLLGHEAGHAYDVAGGGNKRLHADFVAARAKDILEAPPKGLTPGRDDYFMTKVESPTGNQSGNDGAYSETFAESFALHFSGNARKWPNLMAFWKINPWGV